MELGVVDRVVLLSILPSEGDVTRLRIVRDLKRELSFTEDELERIKFSYSSPEQVSGYEGEDEQRDVDIGPQALAVVVARFTELNGMQQLTDYYLDTYDKFMPE